MYIITQQTILYSWIPLARFTHHVNEFIDILQKVYLEITNIANNLWVTITSSLSRVPKPTAYNLHNQTLRFQKISGIKLLEI